MTTDIQQHIQAAQERWAARQPAIKQEAAQKAAAAEAKKKADWEQTLQKLARAIPEWALPFVQENDHDFDTYTTWYRICVPNCAPILLQWTDHRPMEFTVLRPTKIDYEGVGGQWYVATEERPVTPPLDFDAAVTLAATFGDAYLDKLEDAENRNKLSITPDTAAQAAPPKPTLPPEQEALRVARHFFNTDDGTVELNMNASLMAIAEHLAIIAGALTKLVEERP